MRRVCVCALLVFVLAGAAGRMHEAKETIDDVLRAVLHSKYTPLYTPLLETVELLEVGRPAVDDVRRQLGEKRRPSPLNA